MNDPFGPTQWSNELTLEEPPLFGLIPCLCEAGWLPLPEGDFIECPTCATT
jgi:hypothetical protein